LLPALERSEDGGRVVNVSSKLHLNADTVDPEVCDSPKHFSRWVKTYARSKLANVCFWAYFLNHDFSLSGDALCGADKADSNEQQCL
jgi:hypothetical protein